MIKEFTFVLFGILGIVFGILLLIPFMAWKFADKASEHVIDYLENKSR